VEENSENHFTTLLEIPKDMKELICEVIVANSDVRFEVNEEKLEYVPQGQELEVAMMKFLIDNDIPAYDMLKSRNLHAHKILNIPFSSQEKMMVVVREVVNDPNYVRVYVKGAPEYILPLCDTVYNNAFVERPFDEGEQVNILTDIVSDMAQRGHKVLSYAYKQMTRENLNILIEEYGGNLEDPQFTDDISKELTYLATFGLEDPIRNTVAESIQLIKYGQLLEENIDRQTKGVKNQVNIRMVTGDHIETAIAVAMRVGIISAEEKDIDGIALTGEVFRERIGEYETYWDEKIQEQRIKFKHNWQFNNVKGKLRIIARATAEDKFILNQGIKELGGLVAMSGYNT